ncbi:MAG: DUF87 domain-containing protein [Chloroflexi bacterium]|nr:DUF87 domain-containing protein [Chloroflexota bacterium]
MPFIEAPTTFYMGRRFDPTTRRLVDEVVYYDSRDLTTHAVVVGMTGSGKTGLCITLLEEAVMDNIPSIVIDPKGDITNLLLAFPELRPEDFQPWINTDDARRAGLEIPEYSRDVAQQWRDGLASWGITPQRVRYFKDNARFSIYTPGSDAGLPISILDAMQAPRDGFHNNEELHRERISGIVTALLALIGKNVEPVKDKEHVLIANIFEYAWRQGRDLTLEDIITQVQKPPFGKLGVFDVDTFFSEKGRFNLAMELNNIIAAPSFQSWIQGEPMDIQSLMYTPDGKPRVSIFYIAHLSDAERMFIVTLLLENMLAWMRTQGGTTSLRSILYFDEVFGYFPPHPYNPPTKQPILRLLKQARAFGLGLVLATQNPGDIDYKGLANAGTWFIGKLQTENDKNKVLSGLEDVESVEGSVNIEDVDRLLSTIDQRVFVMHNVHDNSGAIPIHTRWAMSYLRGPLTRQQIRSLMDQQRQQPYYPARQQQPPGAPYGTPRTPSPAYPTGHWGAEPPRTPGSTPPPLTLPEMPGNMPEVPDPHGTPYYDDYGSQQSQYGYDDPPVRPGSTPPEYGQQPGGYTQPSSNLTQAFGGGTGHSSRTGQDTRLPEGYTMTQPPLSSSMAQYYLPSELTMEQAIRQWEQKTGMQAKAYGGSLILYNAVLLGQTEVRYADRKSGVSLIQEYAFHVPYVERAGLVRWEEHEAPYVEPRDLSQAPFGDAAFGDLSPGLTDSKRLTDLKRDLTDYLYKSASVTLMYNPELDLYGQPDMRRRDFLVEAQNIARQRRDEEIDKITLKYENEFDKLEAKLRRAARDLAADQKQLRDLRNEEIVTGGEAFLSLLRGRTTYTLSRVSRVRRYKGQANEEVFEAEEVIAELEQQLDETQYRLEEELARVNDKWAKIASLMEDYRITPYKKDIYLGVFGIGWRPHWLVLINNQPTVIPAWAEA